MKTRDESAGCLHCGTALTGAFCSSCGQPASTKRMTLRESLHHFVENFSAVDKALPATVLGLTRAPGEMVSRYVAGHLVEYIAPMRYATWLIGLYVLASHFAGVVPVTINATTTGDASALNEQIGQLSQAVRGIWEVAVLLSLPLAALALRGLFRSAGRNFAENLVFLFFVTGQLYLFMILLTPLAMSAPQTHSAVRAILTLAYSTFAAMAFFREPLWKSLGKVLLMTVVQWIAILACLLYVLLPFTRSS